VTGGSLHRRRGAHSNTSATRSIGVPVGRVPYGMLQIVCPFPTRSSMGADSGVPMRVTQKVYLRRRCLIASASGMRKRIRGAAA